MKVSLPLISAFVSLLGIIGLLILYEVFLIPEQSLWDVLENVLITLMGEYPEKPRSVIGRVLQLLLLIFGTFIFGTFVGKISSFFITSALAKEKKMKQFKNHIIICNWNDKAPRIIEQLIEGNQKKPLDIVVISASVIENKETFSNYNYVYFVQGDPTHHATLEELQVFQAKSVILLADYGTMNPDEKNTLIALAIRHLETRPSKEQDIHVVGELVNLNLRRHLQQAGVDEVVSSRDYSSGIIAQTAMFKNMSIVYQQLLTYSDDTNEFYYIEPGNYPLEFIGKTFRELTKLINIYSEIHPENPVILIGIKRYHGEILLNPKPQQFEQLEVDDSLIIMSFDYIKRIN